MSRFSPMDGIYRRVLQETGLISVLSDTVLDNFELLLIPYLVKLVYDTETSKMLMVRQLYRVT